MKVHELSKELNVTNKELIDCLKSKGYSAHSHLQVLEDEMIDIAREHFATLVKAEPVVETKATTQKVVETSKSTKIFKADDMISCRSVCPWKLTLVGVDRVTVYHWENFGDVEYVSYKDLQYFRRKDPILKPKIIIEDADLCSQWSRELGEIYKPFTGVDYPEQLLEMDNDAFAEMLKNTSPTVREIVKVTAMSMIKNENFPDLNKVMLIDSILGTCLKEFL